MSNPQTRHNPTLTGLREALFATLHDLRSKTDPMDIARAKAVCAVAREITDTARVEIDYQRVTGNEIGSAFLTELPATGDGAATGKAPMLTGNVTRNTATGTDTTTALPGGSVTRHKIR
ncbi:MAG: hypothetical protein ABTR92_19710 [Candidatus Accumulibacter phosphatis]